MAFRAYDLLKLVEEHGETLTLRKQSYGAYDPTTSMISGTTTDDYSVTAYFYNYNLGVMDPEQNVKGNRKCLISSLGLAATPDVEDEIIGNANKVVITNVLTMFSAGQAICYICDVRE
jgi:hypothetical protein